MKMNPKEVVSIWPGFVRVRIGSNGYVKYFSCSTKRGNS
jgi:hypothetical protein